MYQRRQVFNFCSEKKYTKRSSNTLMHLVNVFSEQTLLSNFSLQKIEKNTDICIHEFINFFIAHKPILPNCFFQNNFPIEKVNTQDSYSCKKITTTWIQISLQNWNGFFSNASHQITKKQEIGCKIRNKDLSNFNKQCWSLYSKSF